MRLCPAALLLFAVFVCLYAAQPADWRERLRNAQRLQDAGKYEVARAALLDLLQTTGDKPARGIAAVTLNRLALIDENLGNYSEAERFFRRAIAMFREVFGPENENTLLVEQNLADLYLEVGRMGDAKPVLERLLAVRRREPGRNNLLLIQALDRLAMFKTLQKSKDAGPLYEEALDLLSQNGEQNTRDFMMMSSHYAAWLSTMGRSREALPFGLRSTELMERLPDVLPGEKVAILATHASILARIGQYPTAEAAIKIAVSIAEERFGPEHLRTGWVVYLYAQILNKSHRKREGAPLEARARRIFAGSDSARESVTVDGLLSLRLR